MRLGLPNHCVRSIAQAGTDTLAAALSHRDWWNGHGYPFGLSGETIPHCARIIAVADVFDALVSIRPYKRAWAMATAIDHIVCRRGVHFDPECVDAPVDVAGDLRTSWQAAAHAGPIYPFSGGPASGPDARAGQPNRRSDEKCLPA